MALKYVWQAQPLQLLANTAGKVAIAALLVTLHGPKFARTKTIFIWTLAGIQLIFVVIAIAMIYAQCRPVSKLWRISLPGTCDGQVRNQYFAYVQGGRQTEMYLVLLAGSLPGLRPLFNKRMRTSSNRGSSYDYGQRPGRQDNKKHTVLKLSSLPSGRSKAYVSTRNGNDDGSTENILNAMGHGDIMKTTEVNVRSGRSSIQSQMPWQEGTKPCSTSYGSEFEIARANM
ncbi:MAG: hypothetical protein LQ338_001418 [Usnochroma carphineum]|nr:MAG: hypothetical protein LQ338_001418 [Usnochroma carphineum]